MSIIYWLLMQLKQGFKRIKSPSDWSTHFGNLNSKGFSIEAHYLNGELSQNLSKEAEKLLGQSGIKIWKGHLEADMRIFGINRISSEFSPYYDSELLQNFFKAYLGHENLVGYSMFNKITYKEGNVGSGEGWHRDRTDLKQIKSILYLSDVHKENGPFQYILGSHKTYRMILDWILYGIDPLNSRIDNHKLDKLLKREPHRLVECTAKRGDLLLADTRGIHRGKPLESGTRFAVTNYIWEDRIPSHMEQLSN